MANSALTSVGGAALATQSDQETGTATTLYVTPGVQQYHESAAKMWLQQSMSGSTPGIDASYNVTSLTDDGVGIFYANFTTSFSSTTYSFVTCNTTTATLFLGVRNTTLFTDKTRYATQQTIVPYTVRDPTKTFGICLFGDQ